MPILNQFEVEVKSNGVRKYLPLTVEARNLSHAAFVASCKVRFSLGDSLWHMYQYYPKQLTFYSNEHNLDNV